MSVFRRGQISMEVMYSVGVMMIIFIILTGISFNRRLEISHTDEYLDKHNQCFKLADYITSVAAGGDGTAAQVYLRHYTDIAGKGVIIVGGAVKTEELIEATCGYSAKISATSDLTLDPYLTYRILNIRGTVDINVAP